MPDVFLSYAREDQAVAQRLYRDLRSKGVDVWLDSENLLGGSNWEVEIPRKIREAKFIILLLSGASESKRGYVQKEVKVAVEQLDKLPESEILIIPVRLEQCEPSHSRLAALQWIDLFPRYLKGLFEILASLKQDPEILQKVKSAIESQERCWPAFELQHQVGDLVGGGAEWAASEEGFLAFGPYVSLWPGRYTASYHLAIEGRCDSDSPIQVAQVDVTSNAANRTIVSRPLTQLEFTAPGRYQAFQLAFEIERQEDNVEFRVFNRGVARMKLEKVELRESVVATLAT